MLLTTKQVAAKLKISLVRVRNLAKNGHLKDHAPRKDGAKKHYPLFDSREVSEFQKGYVPIRPAPVVVAAPATEGPAAGTGLLSRLDRIEEKIDRLLAVWS